jgi:magnesium chelatase family protein
LLARILTASVIGIEGLLVEVEVDVSNGLPTFSIVGLPSEEVRESRDRVRAALKNSGFDFPAKRIVVNLAPATVRKQGASFDLPIAVGLAIASGQVTANRSPRYLIVGELSLEGTLRSTRGVLCMVGVAGAADLEGVILPEANGREAAVASACPAFGAASLREVLGILDGGTAPVPTRASMRQLAVDPSQDVDFSEVRGQEHAKRAVEVAAAGAHNILLIGPPGSGKTMIARRVPTILPAMSAVEAIETTKVFSVSGLLKEGGLMLQRPFRAPHHTISDAALIGGGSLPRPGEVSLANHGVLFLDEFPEFRRSALEVLRQPLEDRMIAISRARQAATFPANFMLIAAMNPCPCGNLNDPRKACRCTPRDIDRYRYKISGPLLDRIDIHIEVPPARYSDIAGPGDAEGSSAIRARVTRARETQAERFRHHPDVHANAQMTGRMVKRFCELQRQGAGLLRAASTRLGLSARSHAKILKVARTIADLEASARIEARHLAEAIQYRSLDLG